MENLFFLSSKLNFDLCQRAEITLASSISVLHLVNDTSMEMSSFYDMETPKFDFFLQKSSKFNFDLYFESLTS